MKRYITVLLVSHLWIHCLAFGFDTQTTNNFSSTPLSIDSTAITHICGSTPGEIILFVSGGVTPYSFQWSGGLSANDTVPVLSQGQYFVTITDSAAVNSLIDTITINSSPSYNLDLNHVSTTNCQCYDDNTGSITINTGDLQGATPYSFAWGNGSTTNPISNLNEGTYQLTLTDINGCEASSYPSLSVSQPSPLNVDSTISNFDGYGISCYGENDGSITLTVSGGTMPYSYAWSNSGNTNSSISNLSTGTYYVTIEDSNGCQLIRNYTLTEPVEISITETITNVACLLGNSGAIDITISDGYSPYSYSWSTGGSNEDLSNIAAGAYTVTVTDSHSCTKSSSFTVSQPSTSISASIAQANDISCYGANDGHLVVDASGGWSGYSYAWSNNPSITTDSISNLSPGNYNVTVTDYLGCTATAAAALTGPSSPLLITNVESDPVTCHGYNDGKARVIITGGWGGYSYEWDTSPQQNTDSAINLLAGNYSVSISDSGGCTIDSSINIQGPSNTMYANTLNIDSVSCYNGTDGAALVAVNGGWGGYTYSWGTSPIQTNDTAINLAAGNYTVSVTDSGGCTKVKNVTINGPQSALIANVNQTKLVTCIGDSDGEATAIVTGGWGGYTYTWNTSPQQTTPTATNLSALSYDVSITDQEGCEITTSITIEEPQSMLLVNAISTNVVTCVGWEDGSAQVSASGGWGDYSFNWNTTPAQTTNNATQLSAGNYAVTATDSVGCSATATVIISEPILPLSANLFVLDSISCFGYSDGAIVANPTGGWDTDYSFQWEGSSQTDSTLSNLPIGLYRVTIIDHEGCEDTTSIQLFEPSPIVNSFTTLTHPSMCNLGDGSIGINIIGGSPPYSYLWSNSETTDSLIQIPRGDYYVTVKDANLCEYEEQFQLVDPNAPVVVFTNDSIKPCHGESNGALSIEILSGNGDYTYNWSNNSTDQNLIGVSQGIYYVTVEDGVECKTIMSTTLHQHPELHIQLSTHSDSACLGEEFINTETGLEADHWEWTGSGLLVPQSNQDFLIPAATASNEGWFYCEITKDFSDNSCTALDSFYLKVNPLPDEPSIGGDFELCLGEFPATYYIELPDAGMSYEWFSSSGEMSSWPKHHEIDVRWPTQWGNHVLELEVTNNVTKCKSDTTLQVFISQNQAPTETNIVHMPWDNYDLLICEDESPDILYQWGYDVKLSNSEDTLPGGTEQYCYLSDFDTTTRAYWVETAFSYTKDGDYCTYRTYFNGSPYFMSEQEAATYDFVIYPNPIVDDYLNLKHSNNGKQPEFARIYNINGLLMIEEEMELNQRHIDISKLNSGIYTCTIEYEGKVFLTRKFIVL